MKIKTALLVAAFAAVALGTAYSSERELYYKCTNIGGVQEYTIEVNLNTRKAAFFDNDSWSVLGLDSVQHVEADEALPPQMVYNFQGPDAYGKRMLIRFKYSHLSGGVLPNALTPTGKWMEAADGCKAVKAGALESGI